MKKKKRRRGLRKRGVKIQPISPPLDPLLRLLALAKFVPLFACAQFLYGMQSWRDTLGSMQVVSAVNILPRFADVLLKLTCETIFSRKAPVKEESNLETWRHGDMET